MRIIYGVRRLEAAFLRRAEARRFLRYGPPSRRMRSGAEVPRSKFPLGELGAKMDTYGEGVGV